MLDLHGIPIISYNIQVQSRQLTMSSVLNGDGNGLWVWANKLDIHNKSKFYRCNT